MALTVDAVAGGGHKLITCFLPVGVAPPVVKAIKTEKGLATAHVSYGRGVGKFSQTGARHLGDQSEKQILNVVVDADDIFEFIYHEAGNNKSHGGMMLMTRVDNFAPLILPTFPKKINP